MDLLLLQGETPENEEGLAALTPVGASTLRGAAPVFPASRRFEGEQSPPPSVGSPAGFPAERSCSGFLGHLWGRVPQDLGSRLWE